jgi:predicted lipase
MHKILKHYKPFTLFQRFSLHHKMILLLYISLAYAMAYQRPLSFFNNDLDTVKMYAQASYCEPIFDLQKYECENNCSGSANGTVLELALKDEKTTGRVLVSSNEHLKSIYVSFKGTTTWQNWVLNLLAWKLPINWSKACVPWNDNILPEGIQIHAGFSIHYQRMRQAVLDATLPLAQKNPGYQIIFTGHSLGGALATIAAVDFETHYGYGDRISLYTFGTPRVGNRIWAQYVDSLPFASRIYRLQRKGDPVVQVPPRPFGYEHSGQQFQILKDDSMFKCAQEKGSSESPSCYDNVRNLNIASHRSYFKTKTPCL